MTGMLNLLTSKQRKVYIAIESFIKEKGIPPTVREIGEMVGEKTPGAVQGILNRLEQKGVIKREVGMARSIQLVNDSFLYENSVFIPEIKKISRRNIDDITGVYNIVKYHPVSSSLIQPYNDCFLVKCPDNSLLSKGISYNDMLIVSTSAQLNDGDIVLVLYENITLLRYYYRGNDENTITLKADSNLLERDSFRRDEIKIIGKVIVKFTKFN